MKSNKLRKRLQLFRISVAEICLWVLQTAVASIQSTDCDTEWLTGINVVCCREQLLL